MVADLLQPAMPDLARRWLSALLLVPPEERADVVARVEGRIVATYGAAHTRRSLELIGDGAGAIAAHAEGPTGEPTGADEAASEGGGAREGDGCGAEGSEVGVQAAGGGTDGPLEVVHPPQQRDGYVEQVITTYERLPTDSDQQTGVSRDEHRGAQSPIKPSRARRRKRA
jgi:hypothetical protein